MLKKKIQDAMNEQMNKEFYSSYLYLSMSAYFESISLRGHANWMRVQAKEELFHATKFFDHINERGGRALMKRIDAPPSKWASPLKLFKDALKHEQFVTGRIDALVDLSLKEKDHASNIFLQWFVKEQVEEESSVGDVVDKLKGIGEDRTGIFMLDRDLALRVFTPPTEVQ